MTIQHPKIAQVDEFFAQHRAALARQGAVVETWRTSKGRRLGPYFRLDVRDEEGFKKALYLGKVEDPLVAEVRARLAQLQQPLREQQQFAQARKIFRRAQKAALATVASELEKRGLRLQGLEVRGFASLKRELTRTASFADAGQEIGRQPKDEPRQELENQSSGDQRAEGDHFTPGLEKQNSGDQRV
jgi:hypothetical protein